MSTEIRGELRASLVSVKFEFDKHGVPRSLTILFGPGDTVEFNPPDEKIAGKKVRRTVDSTVEEFRSAATKAVGAFLDHNLPKHPDLPPEVTDAFTALRQATISLLEKHGSKTERLGLLVELTEHDLSLVAESKLISPARLGIALKEIQKQIQETVDLFPTPQASK